MRGLPIGDSVKSTENTAARGEHGSQARTPQPGQNTNIPTKTVIAVLHIFFESEFLRAYIYFGPIPSMEARAKSEVDSSIK